MRVILNNGFSKSALLLGLLGVLAACGSDELEKELERSSTFTFVNALNYSADFHVQRRNISTGFSGLFDSSNRFASDVESNSSSGSHTYRYKAINAMVNLGVRNSMNHNDEVRLYKALGGNENFWLIAWSSAGDGELTLIDKAKSDQSGKISVRIFADAIYPISVDGSAVGATKKGDVTAYYALDNCNTSLSINDKTIDLCNGDYGSSYLLVVDSNGKKLIAKE